MPDPEVRIASKEDADELFRLIKAWHAEEGCAPFDEDLVGQMLNRLLEGGGVIGVIGEPGEIEASISLLPARIWYSPQPMLESLWNFVLPEYRKSSNAKILAKFAKKQADLLGIPALLEIVSNDKSSRKIMLYERLFGPRIGASFHYVPSSEPLPAYSNVRVASLDDASDIIELCREAHKESGSFPADEDIAIPVIVNELHGGGVIGVLGNPGELQGSIAFNAARMWYSSSPLIEERWNFVRAQHRKSKNAQNLINFAKYQVQRLNIPLRIGIISNKETEQKVRLYQRMLGEPSAAYFLYRPAIRKTA